MVQAHFNDLFKIVNARINYFIALS